MPQGVTSWKVTADGQVFDVIYPNTAPVINIDPLHEVLYIRKPAVLSLADILRICGVSISDNEETIPLSALQVSGYDGIKWSIANYGDGAYILTLTVTDTPGLTAVRQIPIFIEPEATRITPVDKNDPKYANLPWLPSDMEWGIDEDGNLAIYIPTSPAPAPAPAASLPKTGDVVSTTVPLIALTGASLLFLLAITRRKRGKYGYGME